MTKTIINCYLRFVRAYTLHGRWKIIVHGGKIISTGGSKKFAGAIQGSSFHDVWMATSSHAISNFCRASYIGFVILNSSHWSPLPQEEDEDDEDAMSWYLTEEEERYNLVSS